MTRKRVNVETDVQYVLNKGGWNGCTTPYFYIYLISGIDHQ